MVVHLQTIAQSTFAVVGTDGEIIETRTVTTVIPKLTEDEFGKALVNLQAAREELKLELAQGSG